MTPIHFRMATSSGKRRSAVSAIAVVARALAPSLLRSLLLSLSLWLTLLLSLGGTSAYAAVSEPTSSGPSASHPVSVVDDAGLTVTLTHPAQRIVSLAPHTTEMVFAAGGGNRIVGAVDYSDYPPAAKRIERVGSNTALDLERIVALRPDLIVVWRHGNASRQIDALRALGIPLFLSQPSTLDRIAPTLVKLGELLGTQTTAQAAANAFDRQIDALRTRYADAPPVSVFYQVWSAPLMTLSGKHIVSDVIRLCGGRNVFATQTALAPTVSTEAVLAAEPQAIIAPGQGATVSATPMAGVETWRRWPQLPAVKAGNLFTIDGDLLNRPGPRLADGAAALCADLQQARVHLGLTAHRSSS